MRRASCSKETGFLVERLPTVETELETEIPVLQLAPPGLGGQALQADPEKQAVNGMDGAAPAEEHEQADSSRVFLAPLGLEQYVAAFDAEGYEHEVNLEEMDVNDLSNELGVEKADARKLHQYLRRRRFGFHSALSEAAAANEAEKSAEAAAAALKETHEVALAAALAAKEATAAEAAAQAAAMKEEHAVAMAEAEAARSAAVAASPSGGSIVFDPTVFAQIELAARLHCTAVEAASGPRAEEVDGGDAVATDADATVLKAAHDAALAEAAAAHEATEANAAAQVEALTEEHAAALAKAAAAHEATEAGAAAQGSQAERVFRVAQIKAEAKAAHLQELRATAEAEATAHAAALDAAATAAPPLDMFSDPAMLAQLELTARMHCAAVEAASGPRAEEGAGGDAVDAARRAALADVAALKEAHAAALAEATVAHEATEAEAAAQAAALKEEHAAVLADATAAHAAALEAAMATAPPTGTTSRARAEEDEGAAVVWSGAVRWKGKIFKRLKPRFMWINRRGDVCLSAQGSPDAVDPARGPTIPFGDAVFRRSDVDATAALFAWNGKEGADAPVRRAGPPPCVPPPTHHRAPPPARPPRELLHRLFGQPPRRCLALRSRYSSSSSSSSSCFCSSSLRASNVLCSQRSTSWSSKTPTLAAHSSQCCSPSSIRTNGRAPR